MLKLREFTDDDLHEFRAAVVTSRSERSAFSEPVRAHGLRVNVEAVIVGQDIIDSGAFTFTRPLVILFVLVIIFVLVLVLDVRWCAQTSSC